MKTVYTLFLILFLTACGINNMKYGNKVEVLQQSSSVRVYYKDYQVLVQELRELAEFELWSDEKLKRRMQSLPLGGRILVGISGNTIQEANTEQWLYIVKDSNGNDIIRKNGGYNIPHTLPGDMYANYFHEWYNQDYVNIDDTINTSFTVTVVNSLYKRRSIFKITPRHLVEQL